ncbi:MAG: metallophosphoesterase [Bacteroidales bacterium]|nr:metallophosphoesterase [Bacteroidales bacterium]
MTRYQIIPALLSVFLQASLVSAYSQEPEGNRNAGSLLKTANEKIENEYTIPSWTQLKKAMTAFRNNPDDSVILAGALSKLKPATMPYCVVMNLNGDPRRNMAFTWFTNEGNPAGKVQVVKGNTGREKEFRKPFLTATATASQVTDIPYCIKGNDLEKTAGIPDGTRKSYTAHKAMVSNLKPGTTYSFRVGNDSAWSSTGFFRTADRNVKEFSFIYTADPQATTEADFHISQTTSHAAFREYPDANFWLCTGDHINASGENNSEWEWEQFFETQQDLFLKYPFTSVLGNHDKSPNRNFTNHFSTPFTPFDHQFSTSPGSIYSFVYGNTLFLALSFEDYSKEGYLESLAKWMRKEVEKYPDVTWKIAFYHKNIYTGSVSHQDDNDGIVVRNRFAPLFDSLGIHLALQGHDHIYEVIGPLKDKKPVPGSVSGVIDVTPDKRENVTGKLNGVFDVSRGTLYFLNNSAGKKKYEPRPKEEMDSDEERLGVPGYYSLFTGRFGQTGRPTFSNVKVTEKKIIITTFEVFDDGNIKLFDRFEVVK